MISDFSLNDIIISLITAMPATLMAFAAWHQARETHLSVNSRMTELLELTRKAAADDATLTEKRAEHIRKGELAVITAKINDSTSNKI